jgi:hypothetical protein
MENTTMNPHENIQGKFIRIEEKSVLVPAGRTLPFKQTKYYELE